MGTRFIQWSEAPQCFEELIEPPRRDRIRIAVLTRRRHRVVSYVAFKIYQQFHGRAR